MGEPRSDVSANMRGLASLPSDRWRSATGWPFAPVRWFVPQNPPPRSQRWSHSPAEEQGA